MAFFLSLLWAVFSAGTAGFGPHAPSHAPASVHAVHHGGTVHTMDGTIGGPA
jgi:hypothetical protein